LSFREGRGHGNEGIKVKGHDFFFDEKRLASELFDVFVGAGDNASRGDMIGHG
jgi:hypothetical protein